MSKIEIPFEKVSSPSAVENRSDEVIDVFRSEILDGVDVVQAMVALYHERYSFLHGIAAFLLRRIPKWLRKLFSFECDHHGYHCSQAISKAYRVAGFDLRPDISDWATTPGDLAKSKKLRKIGRLVFSQRLPFFGDEAFRLR